MDGMSQAHVGTIAAQATTVERADFLTKTYAHLMGAVGAFALILFMLVNMPGIEKLVGSMVSGYNWAIVLIAFMAVSWVAHKWASSATSLGVQYMGLGLYVMVEAVIFTPIVYIATVHPALQGAVPTAALMTGILFTGLTVIVFMTRSDFSWMRGMLWLGGLVALGLIVSSIFFGMQLGVWFSVAMIALMCGYILYETSNVLHHYRTGQHVAAALALFASVATLFYYVLRLVIALQSRD